MGQCEQETANMQVRHLPWGAITVQGAHDKAKIVASSVHQVAFGNIVRASERHPGQVATAFDESETSFHQPGAETAQPFALVASGAAAIGVEFTAGNPVAMPAAALGSVLHHLIGRRAKRIDERLRRMDLLLHGR